MKLRGEAGPLRIDHTRSNEIRSEDRSPVSWRHSTPSGGDGQQGIATKSHKKGCAQAHPPSRALRPLREIVPRQARQERQEAGMAGAAATSGRCHKNGKRQNGFSCTFVFFVAMDFLPAKGRCFSRAAPVVNH